VGTDEVQVAKKFLGNRASLRATALDLEGTQNCFLNQAKNPIKNKIAVNAAFGSVP
jgi:hypothetical protein